MKKIYSSISCFNNCHRVGHSSLSGGAEIHIKYSQMNKLNSGQFNPDGGMLMRDAGSQPLVAAAWRITAIPTPTMITDAIMIPAGSQARQDTKTAITPTME